MNRKTKTRLLGAAVVLVLLWVLWPSSDPELPAMPSYPPALAEAIRDSVRMAQEARDEASAHATWSGRWRLLALVLGILGILGIACLLLVVAALRYPEEAEILDHMRAMERESARAPKRGAQHRARDPPSE